VAESGYLHQETTIPTIKFVGEHLPKVQQPLKFGVLEEAVLVCAAAVADFLVTQERIQNVLFK
jgi:chaperone required for assembly of F1-ATPase